MIVSENTRSVMCFLEIVYLSVVFDTMVPFLQLRVWPDIKGQWQSAKGFWKRNGSLDLPRIRNRLERCWTEAD